MHNQIKIAHQQVYNPPLRNNPLSILLTISPVLLLIWIFSRRFRQKKNSVKKNEDYDFIE